MNKMTHPLLHSLSLGLLALAFALGSSSLSTAQAPEVRPDAAGADKPGDKPGDKAGDKSDKPKEESTVTDHSIKIGGQTVAYKATAGNLLLKDDAGEPIANFFYVAYTRSDVKDLSTRPITFAYNGGPGSASLWLHMGALGPRRVATTDPEATPNAPFKLVDNAQSILDKTDIVMIDPIGTGFSRAAGKAKDKDYWGVDSDAKSIAHFIKNYISKNNRWNSPKFLLGESYGTFRNAAVVNHIQNHDGIYFNGVIMVSMVLDLGTISFLPGDDLSYILYLPSYAATACYHKVLTDCGTDLNSFLQEARKFASTEYALALLKGDKISAAEKADMAAKLSRYTGLSADYIAKANLRVVLFQFMQELQRSRGLNTGRLDSRFSGPIIDQLSEGAEEDAQSNAISGAYVGAFNSYVREELKYVTEKDFHIYAEGANGQWDWKHEGNGGGFPGAPNVEGDLINAMQTNLHLKVQVENGLYDMATPFYGSEYTVDHLGLPARMQGRIKMDYYDAGHMMYVHDPDLIKLHDRVASFIEDASK